MGRPSPAVSRKIEQARDYCRRFIAWYNTEHRHVGIALLTHEEVHLGRADERRNALHSAYAEHPKRFVRGRPNRQP